MFKYGGIIFEIMRFRATLYNFIARRFGVWHSKTIFKICLNWVNSRVGLSRFTHVTIRFDSVRSRPDRFDPIHYPFVQTNTTKIANSECHLNDLLNKITMNKMTMNKITMNKEHKIHQPVTVIK